eukprot:5727146-Amphidinium_carterae.1
MGVGWEPATPYSFVDVGVCYLIVLSRGRRNIGYGTGRGAMMAVIRDCRLEKWMDSVRCIAGELWSSAP